MYGKLFESMYDGTLVEHWQGLVTFQQMVILCDSDGVLDKTSYAIHRRTGIPLEIIEKGIEILESPDPFSRTPDEEGRRIIRLDEHRNWGWRIVNHSYYKGLLRAEEVRAKNRERVRRHREKRAETSSDADLFTDENCNADVTACNADVMQGNDLSRYTYTDTYTDKNIKQYCDLVVQVFHKNLPNLSPVKILTSKRISHIKARSRHELQNLADWQKYFTYVSQSPFLMGEIEPKPGNRKFIASFDWLINETNYAKVCEKKYHQPAED